ncbi:putative lipopolysaccharide biosynthesis protein Wzz-like protein [[Pasteurella] mairii]|uniref:Putative lipopolysaccharide biosynthesis protein Wzz-like protein n=1 Tax=[Pasteurella] mairii TaxID=757 RepID=A0A379B6X7_9PAST|nr:putative lipopolysaccharide biosynthesis protein Wzz-like protein [[Pasteurella] mairii]
MQNKTGAKQILILLLFLIIFAIGGYAASYLVKPQWKVEVQLAPPTTNELGNYYSLFSMYQLVTEDKNEVFGASDIVYQELTRQFLSYDTLREFWQNNEYYKQKMTGDATEDRQLLDNLVRRVKVTLSNREIEKVSLELDNPKQTMDLMTALIDFVNMRTRNAVYGELIIRWKNVFNQVNSAVQLDVDNLATEQRVAISSWQGKLSMMKSVNALDNKLMAFRFMKAPDLPFESSSPNKIQWGISGAGVGFLVGLFLLALFNLRRK